LKSKFVFTYKEPLEALQLKQWHKEQVEGNDLVAIETVTAPQLHAPLIVPEEFMLTKVSFRTLRS
jgi:hypothetical protein